MSQFSEIGKKMQGEFMKTHKLGTNSAAAIRTIKGPKHLDDDKKVKNPAYKTSPLYHKAQKHTEEIHRAVRDNLHSGYSRVAASHHDEFKEHLLSTYIKGKSEHALPYVKVTGTGGNNKPANAHITDPSDNDTYHKIKNAKKFSLHPSGAGTLHINSHDSHDENDKGHRVMSLQVKHGNGPLTPITVNAS